MRLGDFQFNLLFTQIVRERREREGGKLIVAV